MGRVCILPLGHEMNQIILCALYPMVRLLLTNFNKPGTSRESRSRLKQSVQNIQGPTIKTLRISLSAKKYKEGVPLRLKNSFYSEMKTSEKRL